MKISPMSWLALLAITILTAGLASFIIVPAVLFYKILDASKAWSCSACHQNPSKAPLTTASQAPSSSSTTPIPAATPSAPPPERKPAEQPNSKKTFFERFHALPSSIQSITIVGAALSLMYLGLWMAPDKDSSRSAVATSSTPQEQVESRSSYTPPTLQNYLDAQGTTVSATPRYSRPSSNSDLEAAQYDSGENLTPSTELLVCRAAIATVFGRAIDTISGERINQTIVVHYRRPQDNQRFEYSCKFSGDVVIWRGMLEDGWGRWRDHPDDPRVTFKLNEKQVIIQEGNSSPRRFDAA
tara:strand:+ start:3117 stop:4010 length:894 start_codon:yes stop_codon:yes gene_type:complete